MVAHREQIVKSKPNKRKWWLGIPLLFLLFMGYKSFTDGFYFHNNNWEMKESYKDKVLGTIDNMEECEVYYLLALDNGYYDCSLCDRKSFLLKQGEIYKVGMSCNGRDRYNSAYYRQMRLEYVVVRTGTMQECRQEEIRELGNYPVRAQNMGRPDPTPKNRANGRYKLLLPPGNSGLKGFHNKKLINNETSRKAYRKAQAQEHTQAFCRMVQLLQKKRAMKIYKKNYGYYVRSFMGYAHWSMNPDDAKIFLERGTAFSVLLIHGGNIV